VNILNFTSAFIYIAVGFSIDFDLFPLAKKCFFDLLPLASANRLMLQFHCIQFVVNDLTISIMLNIVKYIFRMIKNNVFVLHLCKFSFLLKY
jgi:hypothetical protein